MARNRVYFDDSLPLLVETVVANLGADALVKGVVLRDTSGRLCFFAGGEIDESVSERLKGQLLNVLGVYGRRDRILATPLELGATDILHDPAMLRCRVGEWFVRVVDRRLAGADWVRPPVDAAKRPPRFVFASLKGGVGRSTALSVVATHLASRGGRVLAVDLDLEAPGLGAFLLNQETLPEFGMIDALVENGLQGLDDEFLADLVGPSSLASRSGRIDVLPAFGRRSLNNPTDVLGKLARAYAEDVRPDGSAATILDQVRELIERFADPTRYDAILIDARAGLHETTASAVLGLGAEVLLFGLDEEQTFQGYTALLAHLAQFIGPEKPVPEWVERLSPVHAKAPVAPQLRAEFDQKWEAVIDRCGLLPTVIPKSVEVPADPVEFRDVPWEEGESISDETLLPQEWSLLKPIAILWDERYRGFDPMHHYDLLTEEVYKSTFGALIDFIEHAVFPVVKEAP